MTNFEEEIHLCPGTFLTLLMKAKNEVATAHEKEKGISYSNSDDDVFAALIRVAFQNYEVENKGSFHTFTNKYKQCNSEAAKSIPLANENAVEALKKTGVNVGFCIRMQNFIKDYIKETELKWLVNAIIELIEVDSLITDDNKWYMAASFKRETSTLRVNDSIYIDWFLSSVWLYAITESKHNRINKDVYDSWFMKVQKENGFEFESNIGANNWVDYKILWYETPGLLVEKQEDEEQYEEREFDPNICPAIGVKPPLVLAISKDVSDYLLEDESDINTYLNNVYENNHMIQTFYYEQRTEFDSFYVRNNLRRKVGNISNYHYAPVDNSNVIKLSQRTKQVIITGTGGLGKSMMMHYLLLQAIKDYENQELIPLFVRLKDFGTETNKLKDYLYEEFETLSEGAFDEEAFEGLLRQGKFILLLDGMDEIQTIYRGVFEREMKKLAQIFKSNIIVISSRPNSNFRSIGNKFEEYELQPFTQEQAVEMIEKLDFSKGDVKERFLEKLKTEYYRTHRSFAQNPLLLTIMLTTFSAFGKINSDANKVHLFYEEAFIALAQKHDANKMGGAVNREFATGFSTNRLADYMSRFCAYSYMEKKSNFTKTEFDYYFNAAKKKLCKSGEENVTADDFMFDLEHNVCLIYPESLKWEFTHRSFQEYFCARFFNENAFDDQLFGIGMELEKRGQQNGDLTFRMLYDMNPSQIEAFILLPYLESLYAECDAGDGYRTFLEKIYPTIWYISGDTDGGYSSNESDSFLFEFIIGMYDFVSLGDYFDNRIDMYEDFVDEEYVTLCSSDDDPYFDSGEIKRKSEVDDVYFDTYGDYEPCGYECSFEIETVYNNSFKYQGIIEELEATDCPAMIEYVAGRNLMNKLQEKKEARSSKKSFLDMF